ncbi:unnamed protein product [Polarella glacialis]|uniref:Uncharacterized protein n=1 Tax=Polarella glacialis TaxID=89957 RepID=A0A813GKT9_POLGL|nr:unnamed protein product [Polarella glacialis]
MGKKRKKSSSSSSSSSDKKKKKTKKSSKKEDKKEDKKEEKKEEKKAPVVAPPRGGARFNALDSDDEDGGVSKAGLSSASAADLFNKKQWEMMARMKEAQIREKDEQRATNREMKRAKKMAEEEEAAAEAASLEKASKLHELSSEQKEKRKADAEAAAVARKFGPSGPMGGVSQRSVGDVMYSSDLHIGEGHGGFGGAGV